MSHYENFSVESMERTCAWSHKNIDPSDVCKVEKPAESVALNELQYDIADKDKSVFHFQSISIPVTIRVSDVNDNKPHFLEGPFSINVSEQTLPGSTIMSGLKVKLFSLYYLIHISTERKCSFLRIQIFLSSGTIVC